MTVLPPQPSVRAAVSMGELPLPCIRQHPEAAIEGPFSTSSSTLHVGFRMEKSGEGRQTMAKDGALWSGHVESIIIPQRETTYRRCRQKTWLSMAIV